ncbi:hypothetical protein [Dictyobacter arantiisoli]|uniref:hypothetical protein n=1 Tax=Dictyobacter arantiisoli TaxID=2014874 RepID=UPI001C0ECAEC|nr:hypothetical protein [Dictyobacter arantiisoli]
MSQNADIASTSWLTTTQPPAHWLKRVLQGAPELVEPGDTPRQQVVSNSRPSSAQPVATQPSGNTYKAPAQLSKSHNQRDRANGVESFKPVNKQTGSPIDNQWIHTDRPMDIHLQPGKPIEASHRPENVEHQGSENQREASHQFSAKKREHGYEFGLSSTQRFPSALPRKSLGTYPEMHWPSLPDEEIAEQQDWEMMQRTWERQQRLNEEQRGIAWNA